MEKGPLKLYGTEIDTEWRSDWKWDRIKGHVGSLEGKVVADVGCANGYFMYRMLEGNPKTVVGIDPNMKAWLEFESMKKFAGSKANRLQFEVLDANELHFPACFDVVFCLGVLYHTTDPVGMLRTLWKSMTPNGTLIIDCQGIDYGNDDGKKQQTNIDQKQINKETGQMGKAEEKEEEEDNEAADTPQLPLALMPRKSYANAGGIWFLPNQECLRIWLTRAHFKDIEIFYADKLSTDEQRATEWADIRSLQQALDPKDMTRTIEGYPAPHRFYLRATRG
eukprot:CAMPEP_0114340454 /NCGR_PEP_ID=MMETSP0101-20121206/8386_1 /TAXON_ID=38822 ORGANISM="Pteridomonas danica, Strain PT" /NCGR_SAMPLE_ID=MMETSP0101 /ASSEMBLY_ACC=CAM_ASM_000211 /LENGTH=278 /DNA_ID=CAMNT_0001473719 /DNA_START=1120 /DNA_END=1957 /DNA_ORIENTATION=-